jgi:chemosensory pili system protein ChpA (sensor histidine kinase/response regulator)
MTRPARADASALVLVVDDDELVRDMVAATLTRAGYRVALAADGAAAIERLRHETPDLILTDLFMPNCDGIELLRSGLLSRADAPVIAMSGGYAGIDMLSASQALGADAAIAKPFMPRELVDLVRRTLGEQAAAEPRAANGRAGPEARLAGGRANACH